MRIRESMRIRKRVLPALLAAALLLVLTACGGSKSYADGTYEGISGDEAALDWEDQAGGDGYGVANVTIEGGVITGCTFAIFEPDGTQKDAEYGKSGGQITSQDYYNKAQRAVLACDRYAEELVRTGSPDKVDAVSGATICYEQFQAAVRAALDAASS